MQGRNSRQAFVTSPLHSESLVREYAARRQWVIGDCNVLVEGESDLAICERASLLHEQSCGAALLGPQFRIIPAGFGRQGGVRELEQQFQTLQSLIDSDSGLPLRERVRVIALFDDDDAGRRAFRAVTGRYSKWRPNVDVFLVRRQYPALPIGDPGYASALNTVNSAWHGLDCEIEDLISAELLRGFAISNPRSLRASPVIRSNGHHFEWNAPDGFKRLLRRHIEQRATLQELDGIIRLLAFLRSVFGLATVAVPTPPAGVGDK